MQEAVEVLDFELAAQIRDMMVGSQGVWIEG